MTHTLGNRERLKKRKLINLLFREGKRIFTPTLKALFVLQPRVSESGVQVAVAVSSKIFRRAVDRNRIKRLMRESWRLNNAPLRDSISADLQMLVFIIYTGNQTTSFQPLEAEMKMLISRLQSFIKTKN